MSVRDYLRQRSVVDPRLRRGECRLNGQTRLSYAHTERCVNQRLPHSYFGKRYDPTAGCRVSRGKPTGCFLRTIPTGSARFSITLIKCNRLFRPKRIGAVDYLNRSSLAGASLWCWYGLSLLSGVHAVVKQSFDGRRLARVKLAIGDRERRPEWWHFATDPAAVAKLAFRESGVRPRWGPWTPDAGVVVSMSMSRGGSRY